MILITVTLLNVILTCKDRHCRRAKATILLWSTLQFVMYRPTCHHSCSNETQETGVVQQDRKSTVLGGDKTSGSWTVVQVVRENGTVFRVTSWYSHEADVLLMVCAFMSHLTYLLTPYSIQGLSPCDFHLIPKMKAFASELFQRFFRR